MYRLSFLLIILSITSFYSCDTEPTSAIATTPPISITEANYTKVDSNQHYEINLSYPVIHGSISESILNQINNHISESFYAFVPQKSFIESHQALPDHYYEQPDLYGVLQSSYGVTQCDSMIHIWFSVYQYPIGAAHGSTQYHTLHFNLHTGAPLELGDFMKLDSQTQKNIKRIINKNLPDSTCWGIEVDSTIQMHIEKFTIGRDSIHFKINDYELCPFAFSEPNISIHKSVFDSILAHGISFNCLEISPEIQKGDIATH